MKKSILFCFCLAVMGVMSSCNNNSKSDEETVVLGKDTAVFSISPEKKVRFSQGNLQYQASTGTWRFADNQCEMIGDSNKFISPTYAGWIDLFGWGTSGWSESGAKEYQPYSTSMEYDDYYVGGNFSTDLTGNYANADWGVYNKISNGGDQAGLWRTLTFDEWFYLLNTREHAAELKGFGDVDGVAGMMMLPDNWVQPEGISFIGKFEGKNVYTKEEWKVMEDNGAILLCTAGHRNGEEVVSVGEYGDYWTSSYNDEINSYYINFNNKGIDVHHQDYNRGYGRSVRLVQDVK